mgnify:CR=1 FL=1
MTDLSPTPREEPYTIDELAQRWGVHTETVLRKIRNGELACIEISARNLLVPANDVREYEGARTVRRISKPPANPETPIPPTTPSPGPSESADDPAAASSRRARLKKHARGTH